MNKKLVVEILIVLVCIFLLSVGTAFAPCYPPNNNPFCEGNLDYDCDVDGSDAAMFKTDFGRSGFSSPCSPAGPAQVARTGQVSSWFPYDDGYTQCGIASPDPRFTDNGDGTVTDNLTGLIWLKDADCLTKNQTCAEAMYYCNWLHNGMCNLADDSIDGDWRLPTVREMSSLIDYGRKEPAIPPGVFTNQDIWVYCTSTPYLDNKDYIWCVNTQYGDLESYIGSNWFGALCVKKTRPYCPPSVTTVPTTTSTSVITTSTTTVPAECVALSPLGRWCDQGNGTVKDMTTGLVWLKDAGCMGEMNWYSAIELPITNLRSGDCTGSLTDGSCWGDWRLPTLAELHGLSFGTEYIHGTYPPSQSYFFDNVTSDMYWTADTHSDVTTSAYLCVFSDSICTVDSKSGAPGHVWPVRGGQALCDPW